MSRKDDIIKITELYGVFDKDNHHSFTKCKWQIKVAYCGYCNQLINPIFDHGVCLRCGSCSHNECQKLFPVCPKFSVNGLEVSNLDLEQSVSINDRLDGIVQNICNLPHIFGCFPTVGSEYCLWKSSIISVGSIYNIASPDKEELNENSAFRSLSSIETFPGKVAYVCCKTLISLQFNTLEEHFVHTRACIDTIALSFFVGRSEADINIDNFTTFSSYAETFLFVENGRAQYDKIFQQLTKVSRIVQLIGLDKGKMNNFSADENVMKLSVEFAQTTSPKSKLACLVRILQLLSMKTGTSEVDTDELLATFSLYILFQMQTGMIDWYAECLFLSSSLVKSSPSIESNGIEEYAIVTLQQCLQILLKS